MKNVRYIFARSETTFTIIIAARSITRINESCCFVLHSLYCVVHAHLVRTYHERWYVGTAVPKGGVGGLPGVVEQLDVGAAAPKALCAECIETLCRVGDEVVSMLVVGAVWRSSSRGLTSSSSLERLVFVPPTAFTASSLRLGRRSSRLG
jgi:hypothetical protein